jgi:hypothetical protein
MVNPLAVPFALPLRRISTSAILSRAVENGEFLSLSDSARQFGLYILGRPPVGKSWLIVNLILSDIKAGHGVFFLDPHGDAITDLLYSSELDNRFLLLDPQNTEGAFRINVLECADLEDARARSYTFTKANVVFDKLCKNTFEKKPWLQLILQNTIYAFIENEWYTIAEFPLFLRDSAFRAYIVNNIRYNRQVKDYWLNTFASKTRRDRQAIMEAAGNTSRDHAWASLCYRGHRPGLFNHRFWQTDCGAEHYPLKTVYCFAVRDQENNRHYCCQ